MAVDEDAQAVTGVEKVRSVHFALTRHRDGNDGLPPARRRLRDHARDRRRHEAQIGLER